MTLPHVAATVLATGLIAGLFAISSAGCSTHRNAPAAGKAPSETSTASVPAVPSPPASAAPDAASVPPAAPAPVPSAPTTAAPAPQPEAVAKATPAPATAPPKPSVTPPKPAAPPPLDLAGLEKRLRDTKAIGVFTKISLKNQVDDLLQQFKAFHDGQGRATLNELRERYNGLMLKVLSLLQRDDPSLARDLTASRDAIWGILTDRVQFAKVMGG